MSRSPSLIRTVFSLIQAHHSRSCSLSTFKTKRIIQTLKFEMNAAVHDQSDRATNHLSVKETVDHEKGEEHNCSESFHIAILADSELPNQSEEIVAKDGETFVVDKKLAIYFHPMCSQHRIPDHPEHHIRVDGILDILRDTWKNSLLFREARAVTDEQILLFHTPAMLKRFRKLADNAQQTYKLKKSVVCLSIDSDTHVMWQTRPAAYYAAGSVLTALDSMYAPPSDPARIDTAFCCVRPPGHHAERNKAGGFCFFNNVAIGARYAQQSLGVERVAVLDFDVHHGNGTEEGFADDPTLFYGSTHGRDHYPGTGHDPSPLVGERATCEADRRIVNRLLTPGPKSRPEFFVKWREILAEMERFRPQLVIMSTGFDAHDDDPLADCELQDEDYYWVTAAILASCGRVGAILGQPVRYLSVLEGGYDVPAIRRSAVCHVRALLEGIPPPAAPVPVSISVATTVTQRTASATATASDADVPTIPPGAEEPAAASAGAAVEVAVAAVEVDVEVEKEDGELAALREYLEECGISIGANSAKEADK